MQQSIKLRTTQAKQLFIKLCKTLNYRINAANRLQIACKIGHTFSYSLAKAVFAELKYIQILLYKTKLSTLFFSKNLFRFLGHFAFLSSISTI